MPHPNPHSLSCSSQLPPSYKLPVPQFSTSRDAKQGICRKLFPSTDQFNTQTGSSAGSWQSPVPPMQQWARAGWLPSLDSGPTTQPSIREATRFPRAREFLAYIFCVTQTLKILWRNFFSCGQRLPRPVCTLAGHGQSVLSSKGTEGHGGKLSRNQICSRFYFSPALLRSQVCASS